MFLFTPGPTNIPPLVLEAMRNSAVHHRSASFKKLVIDTLDKFSRLIDNGNNKTLLLTSSGTGAMQAVVTNFCLNKKHILTIEAGKFGQRWTEILKTFGLKVTPYKVKFGNTVDLNNFKDFIKNIPPIDGLLLQHCETSTGIILPVHQIVKICKEQYKELFVAVDCISSFMTTEVSLKLFNCDAIVVSSQKALSLPAGLSILILSNQAVEILNESGNRDYYFNLKNEIKGQAKGITAYTPATHLIIGLNTILDMIYKETLNKIIKRHKQLSLFSQEQLKNLGFTIFPDHSSIAPGLTAVYPPDKITPPELIKELQTKYGYLIANGQGELKDKIVRIAHLGFTTQHDLINLFNAIEDVLSIY